MASKGRPSEGLKASQRTASTRSHKASTPADSMKPSREADGALPSPPACSPRHGVTKGEDAGRKEKAAKAAADAAKAAGANASAANASAPPTLDDEHSGFEAVSLGQYDAKVRVRG